MYMYINTISYPRYNFIVSYISCFFHFLSSFPLISPFLGLTSKISHNRQRTINIRNRTYNFPLVICLCGSSLTLCNNT